MALTSIGTITIVDVNDGPSVVVTSNIALAFTSTDGVVDAVQSDIVLTAKINGIPYPTGVWSFVGFASAPTASTTLSQTITAANLGTNKSGVVTYTVNSTYIATTTIVRLDKSTAAAGADKTSTAISAGTAITGGGITFSGGGSIQSSGKTYGSATAGVFLGYDATATAGYKFDIGDSTSYLRWDGANLAISGNITASSLKTGTLMVGNEHIYTGAVTTSSNSILASSFTLSNGVESAAILTSASMTCAGDSNVSLGIFLNYSITAQEGGSLLTVKVKRNGTTFKTITKTVNVGAPTDQVALPISDTPGSGSYIYTVTATCGLILGNVLAGSSIIAMVMKK